LAILATLFRTSGLAGHGVVRELVGHGAGAAPYEKPGGAQLAARFRAVLKTGWCWLLEPPGKKDVVQVA
jgi:hypothetical protein